MFDLVFRTTNKAKFAHLEYALREYNINLKTVGEYGKPYTEPRVLDRKTIIEESILDSIRRELKKQSSNNKVSEDQIAAVADPKEKIDVKSLNKIYRGSPFIIEDTSVIINALSTKFEEIPGVDIKYWMRNMTFEKLDSMLKEKGNDRTVTVRSDIVLFMPDLAHSIDAPNYYNFVGKSTGRVIEKELVFETNRVYPWLDNKTFNKWFVPDDEEYPISMLNINSASASDFRINAANKLAKFLEENNYIRKNNINTEAPKYVQLQLFKQPGYIICGPTCSGKTALAKHIAHNYNYYHIEASDFMYLKYHQLHGANSGISIHEFAKDILNEDPYVVSRQIIKFINKNKSIPFTITGFRVKEEIEYFLRFHRGENPIKLLFIDTELKIRYNRNIKRNRGDKLNSIENFIERDDIQFKMGLNELTKCNDFVHILNEKTIREYYKNFDLKYANDHFNSVYRSKNNITKFSNHSPTLEQAILLTLLKHYGDEYFTTHEISKLINNYLSIIRKEVKGSNVGRYFNQRFHPYYEIKLNGNKNTYRLSQTGISEAILQEQTLIYKRNGVRL